MHRAFLAAMLLLGGCSLPRWPVEAPVTSPFGLRMNGLLPEVHHGIDLGVPSGTPVRVMASGRVVFAGWQGGYGLVVLVDHGVGVTSLYAHLSALQVERGQEVRSGQVIALSGATGETTAPHLHFEVRRRGRAEDPVPLLGGFP